MIASIAIQMMHAHENVDGQLDLDDAIDWGIVSGGYTCFYHGGTFHEAFPGQKRHLIESLYLEYLLQTGSE